jgi:hypothetical protein
MGKSKDEGQVIQLALWNENEAPLEDADGNWMRTAGDSGPRTFEERMMRATPKRPDSVPMTFSWLGAVSTDSMQLHETRGVRLEPMTGLEPVTCGLRNRCSTN